MTAAHAKAPILAWILTALSCLLAGLAFVAVRPTPPVESGPAATAASRTAVLGFYAAVNAVIATGDSAPLAAVLAPDYAEADGTGTLVPGRATLERHLRTLHEITPDLRLHAAEVLGDGDRVVAVVATRGTEQMTALGLPLIVPVVWGPVEIFRVTDGRIAERLGAMKPDMALERRVAAPLELPLPSARVLTLQRVSVAPAASVGEPAVDGLRVLAVEAGTLTVTATGTTPGGAVVTLATGDWLELPTGAAYEARNAGREPAVLLEVLASVTTAAPGAVSGLVEGDTTQVLAGGLLTPLPQGKVVLTTGRLTLAPGAGLAWAGPAGPTMLVVEAGTLELATEGASAWVRSADGSSESRQSTTLAVGDGARIGMGTGAAVRNAGADRAEVLVVTLLGAVAEPALAD